MYNKPFKSFKEQVELLESRGLSIKCKNYAQNKLEQIGYQRLSEYWYPFLESPASELFTPGSFFEDAVDLFNYFLEFSCEVVRIVGRL